MTGSSPQDPASTSTQQQQQQQHRESLSLLYFLARGWAWEAVTFRCQSHPEEASVDMVDYLGDTVLHWVAFGRPPMRPVRALLEISPGLARVKNKKGLLPLHVACSYRASAEVIEAIAQAYPEGSGMATLSGSYPLHMLCDFGCNFESLLALLRSKEGLATVHKLDRTYQRQPIYILNARKNLGEFQRSLETLRRIRNAQRRRTQLIRLGQAMAMRREDEDVTVEIIRTDDFWRKASALVLAAAIPQALEQEDMSNTTMFRAFLKITACPPALQEFAVLLHEDLLRTPLDEVGNLPLHLAALNGTPSLLKDVLSGCRDAAEITNARGELPLELYLMHVDVRWSDGPSALVEAHPASLIHLELDERLYPQIWSQMSTPDALFRALRCQAPAVLASRW